MEHKKTLKIQNDLGLHGRAAAKIVELSRRYKSKLFFKKNGQGEVDGSNILSILTLSGSKGTDLDVTAIGEDSMELLEELSKLFDDKFGEGR
ncbi:MAG: HPr family phosphocarrier protein [Deltaproteobacteria bacterium]|nr:HPr family phosphocarrier protein [Deltaproteobacteria bacterium]